MSWRIAAVLLLAVAVGGALTGFYRFAYDNGQRDERTASSAALAELNDQLELVTREASKRESLRLAQMAELEQHVEELRSAIDADPDADRPAFGPDSVRRLNSVQ